MKKILVIIIAAIVCFSLGAAAFADNESPEQQDAVQAEEAATITIMTGDGLLTMDIPASEPEWKVQEDEEGWFVISNGTDIITAEHLASGDELPEIKAANDEFANILRVSFSTKDEIFIVTGYAVEFEDMPAIRDAICSLGIPKFEKDEPEIEDDDAAATFNTEGSILFMEIPEGEAEWKVQEDAQEWFAISDGTNRITAEYMTGGDEVPEIRTADDEYADILQVVYSTKDEIFVVTGYAVELKAIPAIRDAICSFRIPEFGEVE